MSSRFQTETITTAPQNVYKHKLSTERNKTKSKNYEQNTYKISYECKLVHTHKTVECAIRSKRMQRLNRRQHFSITQTMLISFFHSVFGCHSPSLEHTQQRLRSRGLLLVSFYTACVFILYVCI